MGVGTAAETVQITVQDVDGNPLPGAVVGWTLSNGEDVKATADASGTLFVTSDTNKVDLTVSHFSIGSSILEMQIPANKSEAIVLLEPTGASVKFDPAPNAKPTPAQGEAVSLTNSGVLFGGAGGGNTCGGATPIAGDGTFGFDNSAATTDGVGDPLCLAFGSQQIDNDVYFAWTANNGGAITVTTCGGTGVDTKIAVYDACGGTVLDCNDDTCGLQSSVGFAATANDTYIIRLGTFPGASGGQGTFDVSGDAGGGGTCSANTCAAPDDIGSGEGTFNFDNSAATTDGVGHPTCLAFGSDQIDNDIWCTWTATNTATYQLDTCGQTAVDTKVAVYTGVACPTTLGSLQACNDDACGLQSSISWDATSGTTYRIRLGTFPGAAGGTGSFTISEQAPPQTCATAVGCQLPDLANAYNADANSGFIDTADNFQVTANGSITSLCWYGVYFDGFGDCVAANTGDSFVVTYFDNAGSSPGAVIGGPFNVTHTEGPSGSLVLGVFQEQIYSASHAAVPVSAGDCVWVQIVNTTTPAGCSWFWSTSSDGDGFCFQQGTVAGDLSFCVDVDITAGGCGLTGPSNDLCADATPISGTGNFAFDNFAAGTDGPGLAAPCDKFGQPQADNDVWYCWTSACTGDVAITTCNLTTVDTKLVVYDGCACPPAGAPIACNDDTCGFQSTVIFPATAGSTYLIRVGTFPGAGGGSGEFNIACVSTPDNDECDDATAVAIPSATAGNTSFAATDVAPLCGTGITAPGVWYTVTGTGTTVTASLCDGQTGYDSKLNVYCGTCDDLTCVVGLDDFCGLQTEVSWCSQAGATYYILVQGFGGATGAFNLVLSENGQSCSGGVACLPAGACCIGETCVVTTADDCGNQGGSYQGDGTDCGGGAYASSDCNNALEDISATGTQLALPDDGGQSVPIGFNFDFYGSTKTSVAVCSNGYLTFGVDLTDFTNDPIPTALDPNDAIFPLWDDYDPTSGGTIQHATLGTSPNRRFIAQWTGVPQFGDVDSNTFQAVLFEGSNAIEFRYGAVTPEPFAGDYTIGIENADGSDGLALPSSTAAQGNCASISFEVTGNPCEVECWLVVGGDNEGGAFDAGSHQFGLIQVSDVSASYAVTMIDVPLIPVARAAAAQRMRLRLTWGEPLQPAFYAQVLMWNPEVFPENPEQQSAGLAVYALPDGTVFGLPYGTNDGGIYFNPIQTFEIDGQLYMQLGFTIAGL